MKATFRKQLDKILEEAIDLASMDLYVPSRKTAEKICKLIDKELIGKNEKPDPSFIMDNYEWASTRNFLRQEMRNKLVG